MTGRVQNALNSLTSALSQCGISNPNREALLLLGHTIGIEASRLSLHLNDVLDQGLLHETYDLMARRTTGEPMSHILGYRGFYGRRFCVDSRVLDPRPETETLIEQSLSVPFSSVLDLGTGSGCILVTLLAERPDATGIGTDLSKGALEVATANALKLGVGGRCSFEQSNWFSGISVPYDLIVSNPPYITADEMVELSPGVRDYEPHIALTPGGDGLDAYRAITVGACHHLTQGGHLMVEIGPTQGRAVAKMFKEAGLTSVQVLPDLDGRDRVVRGQNPA